MKTIKYYFDEYVNYEFVLAKDNERDYIIHELRENQGFDKETAKKIYENVIDNYELTEQFLDNCDQDELADYFEKIARDEYEESRY